MKRALKITAAIAMLLCTVPMSAGAHGSDWRTETVPTGPLLTPAVLSQLSCPTRGECLSPDSLGGIAWTQDVDRPTAVWHLTGELSPAVVFDSISCPTVTLCVAIDQAGGVGEAAHIAVSTDPTGPVQDWSVIADRAVNSEENVDCPSRHLCVLDALGGLVVSTDPTGGAATWKPTLARTLQRNDGDLATWTSCPSASLCVTVGENGNVYSSTDPAGGTSAWRRVAHFPSALLDFVDCPTTSLCVALDYSGEIVTSTDPSAPDPTWVDQGAAPGLSGPTEGVSCTAAGTCVAVDAGGDIDASTDPAGPASTAWSSRAAVDPNAVASVHCTSAGLCLAPDASGGIAESHAPASAQPDWRITTPAGLVLHSLQPLTDVSCPTVSLCLASTGDGGIASAQGSIGHARWHVVRADHGAQLNAISCPSIHFCAAIGDRDALVTSADPTGDAAAWAPVTLRLSWEDDSGGGPDDFDAISCPSAQECLAPDVDSSDIAASTDPAGGARKWNANFSGQDDYDQFFGVSCPVVRTCFAAGLEGDVWTEATNGNPTQFVANGAALDDISCPTVRFCVATGTPNPDSGSVRDVYVGSPSGRDWRRALIDPDPLNQLTGIDCLSTQLCVAIDSGGLVIVSHDPAGGAATWHASKIDSAGALWGIDCPSATRCVAVGENGRAFVGRG